MWALQTGDGRRYARVNTTVGELDTVRSISNPDRVVESGDAVYLFSDSLSKVTRIDEALPTDLDDDALRASPSTPAGTTDVVTAGDFVAYRTDSGAIFAGLPLGRIRGQARSVPASDENAPRVHRRCDRGRRSRHPLQLFAAPTARCCATTSRTRPCRAATRSTSKGSSAPLITAAGDTWAVVDADDGDVWLRGADAVAAAPTTGAVVVGEPDAGGIGDLPRGRDVAGAGRRSTARRRRPRSGRGGAVLGTPAQPIVHDGDVFAAWLAAGHRRRCAVELRGPGQIRARLRRQGAGRPAPAGLRRGRRRRHPQRDALRLGVDGAGRRPGRVEPELVAR